MKTIIVTGGTSGIGRALASSYLARGEQVVCVGPDPAKGKRILDEGGDRAFFIRADLSLVSENRRVIDEIAARFGTVDALVLCARYFRSFRTVTVEGFEHNFALYYLSRFLLGYGLVELMETAEAPVVMNLAGPGLSAGSIQWDDLQMESGYDGWSAMFQGGKLNDLLGVSFSDHGYRTRYVLLFPTGTRTGLAGEFDAPTAAQVAEMKRHGQPVERVIPPITALIDAPPGEPLTAVVAGRRIGLTLPSFDRAAAARLDTLTRALLRDEGTSAT